MSAVFRGKAISKASFAEAGLIGTKILEATSELRGKKDTKLNMKVVRKLADLSKRAAILKGSSLKKAQAAIYLIAKQLNSDEIRTVVLTLDLIDVLMKHSNSETYELLANDRNYMAMLRELCMEQRKGINVISHLTPEFVQRKALVMVQRWGIELSASTIISADNGTTTTTTRVSSKQRRLMKAGKKFVELYTELKHMKGVVFPHVSQNDEPSVVGVGMSKVRSRKKKTVPEKTVPCIGGCGFEMPESHLTRMCSKCSKNTIKKLKELTRVKEVACSGGCGFMLPLDHKTGMCWVCSSSTPSPSNTTTTGSSDKVVSPSLQKEDDDLFNFFDDSPVKSTSKGKRKEDLKNSTSASNIGPALFDDLFDTLRL